MMLCVVDDVSSIYSDLSMLPGPLEMVESKFHHTRILPTWLSPDLWQLSIWGLSNCELSFLDNHQSHPIAFKKSDSASFGHVEMAWFWICWGVCGSKLDISESQQATTGGYGSIYVNMFNRQICVFTPEKHPVRCSPPAERCARAGQLAQMAEDARPRDFRM